MNKFYTLKHSVLRGTNIRGISEIRWIIGKIYLFSRSEAQSAERSELLIDSEARSTESLDARSAESLVMPR